MTKLVRVGKGNGYTVVGSSKAGIGYVYAPTIKAARLIAKNMPSSDYVTILQPISRRR